MGHDGLSALGVLGNDHDSYIDAIFYFMGWLELKYRWRQSVGLGQILIDICVLLGVVFTGIGSSRPPFGLPPLCRLFSAILGLLCVGLAIKFVKERKTVGQRLADLHAQKQRQAMGKQRGCSENGMGDTSISCSRD